jgi:NitT/TauT family transport system permease protein
MLETESRERLQEELAGIDALELGGRSRLSFGRRAWTATWPKLAAIAIAIGAWQLLYWSGWKPHYVFPSPATVFKELRDELSNGVLLPAVGRTLLRAAKGYAIALVSGVAFGTAVARSRLLRSAFGSFITGLQTMPSVAWFPLALLLFKRSEAAILFVVILGAAPSIANGVISGIDQIPPLYLRAGRVLGARRLAMYRHVILPAALPDFVAGLKQGWAFAWRSLMAGELVVIIPGQFTIGALMQNSRDFNDAPGLMASMVVVLIIGIVVDAVFFAGVERTMRRRRGLVSTI